MAPPPPLKQDKHQRHKSLASLLRFFEGMELAVELKTGRIYRGVLSSADDFMNVMLDDAIMSSESTPLSRVHIRGATIRYIHFPDDADLPAFVRAGKDRERSAVNKYQRGIRK
jgi:small nuclear ribonucleoprotein (snRNP)-like protein